MRRFAPVLILLAVLSVISGTLMSKISFTGRVGIYLFYRQYNFLKTWWKGALLMYTVWLLLLLFHYLIHRKLSRSQSRLAHTGSLLLALAGLYFTYDDFRHDLSHRWLGERFHLGAYLFWIGWMIICLFFLFQKKFRDSNRRVASAE